ncbi:MAG TPA: helix-turn-helix transcriptional regulator [Solirubrobacteraceae bacterium]|jgi:cytoskeletal protein RodZ|nr:helix-turn-helix transcriptional regulator [Solirubrobacteraceae bacterium]
MAEIGETLRDARMRARIDVSEIEAKTKIRAKYLRALENEEWGLLPGPTFVKSFLRTYAQALGLDGKALVEEYRLRFEDPAEAALEPIVSAPQRSRARPGGGGGRSSSGGPSRGYLAIVGVVVVVIILLIVGLVSNGGGSSTNPSTGPSASRTSSKKKVTKYTRAHGSATATHRPQSSIVALSLKPTATVYVCLIGDNGRKVIPGEELHAGTSTPTFHARHFTITLGNSSVTMYVDGHARIVPPSSQAIGYSITPSGQRKRLAPGSLPTCA